MDLIQFQITGVSNLPLHFMFWFIQKLPNFLLKSFADSAGTLTGELIHKG
jgi:hypothetical protein